MKKILIYGLSTLMMAASTVTFTGCIEETEPTDGITADQVEDGEDVRITWIADGFYALAERTGYEIPILKKLLRMADSFLERWECELLEASGDKPI